MESSKKKTDRVTTNGKANPALSQQYGGIHTGSWVDRLPATWIPYIQLARLSPPIAIILIYFPHLFGILHAAIILNSPVTDILKTSFSLLLWTIFFSNAAHAWNDLIDSPIDLLTSRTKNRPIPPGAISLQNAFLFALSQFLCAFLVLFFTTPNTQTLSSAVPPYVLATIYYPFAKRHTHFVQVILGLTLGWGVIIGSAAMGLNPIVTRINGVLCTPAPSFPADINIDITTIEHKISTSPLGTYSIEISVATSTILLFVASATWTIIYDTIYAHQDLEDDLKNDVKSLAVLFQSMTPELLWSLLSLMISGLILCGLTGGFTAWFGILAAGGSALALGGMILGVDLKDSGSCWWWFKYDYWLTGGSITAGLVGEYIFMRTGEGFGGALMGAVRALGWA